MPLKTYDELRAVDVRPFCDARDGKDENGKKIKIPYLSWARCLDLLHQHGAEKVYYEPVRYNDSFVHKSENVTNKDGKKTGCYFVGVDIHIDDKCFRQETPLMNGTYMIFEEGLTQQRIYNAQQRAFVKGVAIHTGLGLDLWLDDKDTEPAGEDLSSHDAIAIKTRLELLITKKNKEGWDNASIAKEIGMKNEKSLFMLLNALQQEPHYENSIKKL